MPHYGRPVFTPSPARWAPISTRTSFDNSATVHELYTWPFDADTNGSGQKASQSLASRLTDHGVSARTVSLPEGHDPNSFFAQGGDAHQFQFLLEAAR